MENLLDKTYSFDLTELKESKNINVIRPFCSVSYSFRRQNYRYEFSFFVWNFEGVNDKEQKWLISKMRQNSRGFQFSVFICYYFLETFVTLFYKNVKWIYIKSHLKFMDAKKIEYCRWALFLLHWRKENTNNNDDNDKQVK